MAVCRPGTLFQILASKFEGNVLKPGTGGQMFMDSASLVFFLLSFPEKRRVPKGFIDIFDFQTKMVITDAVASFRLRSPALERTDSERTLFWLPAASGAQCSEMAENVQKV